MKSSIILLIVGLIIIILIAIVIFYVKSYAKKQTTTIEPSQSQIADHSSARSKRSSNKSSTEKNVLLQSKITDDDLTNKSQSKSHKKILRFKSKKNWTQDELEQHENEMLAEIRKLSLPTLHKRIEKLEERLGRTLTHNEIIQQKKLFEHETGHDLL